MNRLTEKEIKVLCLKKLRRQRRINIDTIISSEFPLKGTSTRIDIAILKKDFFIGMEIKSQLDTLRRVRNQIDVFSSHFDLLILVLAEKHAKIDMPLPDNVELWEINGSTIIRRKAAQPIKRNAELVNLVSKRKIKKINLGESKQIVRDIFFSEFRKRYEPSSKLFWENFSTDDSLSTNTLAKLSPAYKFKLAQIKLKENKEKMIGKWMEYYSVHSSSVS